MMIRNYDPWIFPHYWMDTPLQHIAKIVWNCSERLGFTFGVYPIRPFCSKVFYICVGGGGINLNKSQKEESK